MTSSGMRRKVDDLGRVVIPAGVRRALGIREGDPVEVTVEGERVVLAKPMDACVFCGREGDDLATYRARHVCGDCVAGLGTLGDDRDAADPAAAASRRAHEEALARPSRPRLVEPSRSGPIDGDALALAAAERPRDDADGQRTVGRARAQGPASTTAW